MLASQCVLLGLYVIIRRAEVTAWCSLAIKWTRRGARNVKCYLTPRMWLGHAQEVKFMIHPKVVISPYLLAVLQPEDSPIGNGATSARALLLPEIRRWVFVRKGAITTIMAAETTPYLSMEILLVDRISGAGAPNVRC